MNDLFYKHICQNYNTFGLRLEKNEKNNQFKYVFVIDLIEFAINI